MENPAVIPIMALERIMMAGISWIFEVAKTKKAAKVITTEMRSVTFLPYCWSTTPASKAERIAARGGVLAAKKILWNSK